MKKIWVMLSIANQYDQPDNNLECWFSEKPSKELLKKKLGIDDNKAQILYNGGTINITYGGTNNVDYRIKDIKEEEWLENNGVY